MGLAVIIGAGEGFSASLARKLHGRGHKLILAARNIEKLGELQKDTDATLVSCDAADASDMAKVFAPQTPWMSRWRLRFIIRLPGYAAASPSLIPRR